MQERLYTKSITEQSISDNIDTTLISTSVTRGRVCQVVETLSRRKVDVCCIQETRYRGGNCRIIMGKDTRYKLYWSGNDKGTAGVGCLWQKNG